MFKEGVLQKIPDGQKVIGDQGYKGYPDKIDIKNDLDTEEARIFKQRARSCHESFYKRIKAYQVLDQRFRHNKERHKTVFNAVCIIMQYDFDNGGRPLFDV
jgi:hypothetical protein